MKTKKDSVTEKEVKRYQSKGQGVQVATVLLVICVTCYPLLAQALWNWILEYKDKHNISLETINFQVAIVSSWGIGAGLQVMYGVIYYLEWDFFERYTVLEGPWPWKEDPVYWKTTLLPKSLCMYFFNALLLVPLMNYVNVVFDIPVAFDTSRGGVPSSAAFVA